MNTKLKENIDFAEFLGKIEECRGDILFCTREGDRLNLSSSISRFVFSAANFHRELIREGEIICTCKEDTEILGKFLA